MLASHVTDWSKESVLTGLSEILFVRIAGQKPEVALVHHQAADREECSGAHARDVCPEGDQLQRVLRRAHPPGGDDSEIVPEPLPPQYRVDRRDRQLDGDADVVLHYRGGGSGPCARPVDDYPGGAHPRHSRGDVGDVVGRADLHEDRLPRRLLERRGCAGLGPLSSRYHDGGRARWRPCPPGSASSPRWAWSPSPRAGGRRSPASLPALS